MRFRNRKNLEENTVCKPSLRAKPALTGKSMLDVAVAFINAGSEIQTAEAKITAGRLNGNITIKLRQVRKMWVAAEGKTIGSRIE